jgi:meso-butanediol dehydrogenase/(S,S)-butanediol dehydrogenase/diacetyl reductase
MPGRLDGKIALITSAGGAVGRASALLFAAEGATVVGCDQQDADTQETVEMVRAAGGEMTARDGVNLGDAEATAAWIDDAAGEHGGLDVLFNNVSALRFGPVDKLRAEDWLFTTGNELDVLFYTTRAVWPHLRARGGGAIVNVGSIAGSRGSWFMPQSAHAASKGGILGLTYQLAVEGGPFGIRVNAVSPSLTRTPATERLMSNPDSPFNLDKARIPLRRIGEPEDIARAVLFLASDDASYITGVNLPVDGGTAAVG